MQNEKIIADVHTHSEFSTDSEQSVELMAQTAVKKGVLILGISDHYDYDYIPGVLSPDNFECNVAGKEKEILRIKELYRDKVTVLNGIELGLDVPNAVKCREITDGYKFDYIIGSQHNIRGKNPYYPEFWDNKREEDAIVEYFENILDSVALFSDFDIFGHLDYPLRYVPRVKSGQISAEDILKDPRIKALCDEVLAFLVRENKALEINTGGIRSALARPNPTVNTLKRFLELGGKYVSFGSDAHTSADIGYRFDEFKAMLLSLGKTSYTIFENRTPIEIEL